ncbi:MAG: hypothetical protein RL885_25995 [Planctomycetota bacterium]
MLTRILKSLALASVVALAFFSGGIASAQSRRAPAKPQIITAAPVVSHAHRADRYRGPQRQYDHDHQYRSRHVPTRQHGYWKTVCEQVWRPGCFRIEHVPARYETRYDSCGNAYRVLISPACQRRVWVPGYWENVERRVWVPAPIRRR